MWADWALDARCCKQQQQLIANRTLEYSATMIQSRSAQAAAVAAKQLQLLLPARGVRSSSLVLPAALPRHVLQHKHKHTYSRHVSQPQPQVRRRWMCAMPGGGGGGGKPGMKPPPRHEYDQFGSQRGARQRTSRGVRCWQQECGTQTCSSCSGKADINNNETHRAAHDVGDSDTGSRGWCRLGGLVSLQERARKAQK